VTLDVILTAAQWLYELWVLFLAVMALRFAKLNGTLTPVAKFLGLPILVFGYFRDWLVNLIIMTVVFFELPGGNAVWKRWPRSKGDLKLWLMAFFEVVTARCQRYADGPPCLRRTMAWHLDHNLMRHFDPIGYHTRWPELGDGKQT
jgi:hypothetical protein